MLNKKEKFNNIEINIISKWNKQNISKQSINKKYYKKKYIFHDGPPFANGLPHYGHLLTGFIKDLFLRYNNMNEKQIISYFGWDCHGLPVELYVEKLLNISGKTLINNYGLKRFNSVCKKSVKKYIKKWSKYMIRQGRWIICKSDYKTMNYKYIESVIWAFKQLYNKGLIYKSVHIMPYSWACGTSVSDFETRIDNSYREKKTQSITLSFLLKNKINVFLPYYNLYLLIWTTTPWTIPSNLAIAIKKNINYITVLLNKKIYIIAKNLFYKYKKELGNNIINKFKGINIINRYYYPPFYYFIKNINSFKIIHADFVTTISGTGIVHLAPGFGEEDNIICKKYNISIVCPIDYFGRFIYPIKDFIGKQIWESNNLIIKYLKFYNLWIKTEQYFHHYPHCWRTDTPLIYKAVSSWYININNIKKKIINNNNKINWIPSKIKKGLFGKWLKNARDWSISRNRFWGCPIPIWKSDNYIYPYTEIYGSIYELKKSFNINIKYLHKPFIDNLIKNNPLDINKISKIRRIKEILDCWFESGSMPFAQIHYPFSKDKIQEKYFAADLTIEYISQTRGWFYTMIVISTAIFNKPPFFNSLCHGIILGNNGEKMSKRLNNYPKLEYIFIKYGSDTIRTFMFASCVIYGQDIKISTLEIQEAQRKYIKPLWNAWNFYSLYVCIDKITPLINFNVLNILDYYILSKTSLLIKLINKSLIKYDTVKSMNFFFNFLDIFNNWYIRRSRYRFWNNINNYDKISAYNTIYFIICILCRLISPFIPFISNIIYNNINNQNAHMQIFPNYKNVYFNIKLVKNIDKIREACSVALYIRNENKIRIRQPLKSIILINIKITKHLNQLILNEINIKKCFFFFSNNISKYINYHLRININLLVKRLPKKIQTIIDNQKKNKWNIINKKIKISEIILKKEEFKLDMKCKKIKNLRLLNTKSSLILLDTIISYHLLLEGIVNDIIRIIQQSRKSLNIKITNKIYISIVCYNIYIKKAIQKFKTLIIEQNFCYYITPYNIIDFKKIYYLSNNKFILLILII